jgi:hypothetical protein
LNGFDNISRVVLSYSEKSLDNNLIIISEKKAKEFDLKPDQIIKGIFSNESKTFEIYVGQDNKYVTLNSSSAFSDYKNYKIKIIKDKKETSKEKIDSRPSLHPKGLLELLSNITYTKIATCKIFSDAKKFNKFIGLLNDVNQEDYVSSALSSRLIKNKLRENGYSLRHYIDNKKIKENPKISAKLANYLDSVHSEYIEDPDFIEEIKNLIIYYNSNIYETIIEKGRNNQIIRILLFFYDFLPVEIVLKKRKVPDFEKNNFNDKPLWNAEINSFITSKLKIQVVIKSQTSRKISVDLIIPNEELYELALAAKPKLEQALEDSGIKNKGISLYNRDIIKLDRNEILDPMGNINFTI